MPINVEAWLSLPRIFSRRSCRFGLPLISEMLNSKYQQTNQKLQTNTYKIVDMTPLQYLENHTMVMKTRRLLYNMVFNRHKIVENKVRRIDKNVNLQKNDILQNKIMNIYF